jgi:hypothetical protein
MTQLVSVLGVVLACGGGSSLPPSPTVATPAPPDAPITAQSRAPSIADSLRVAGEQAIALWRGDTTTPSAHIGPGTIDWAYACFDPKPPFAVIRREASEVQRQLRDVVVGKIASCDETLRCCTLARGTRHKTGAYLDELCFDAAGQLVRVRETNEDACHG